MNDNANESASNRREAALQFLNGDQNKEESEDPIEGEDTPDGGDEDLGDKTVEGEEPEGGDDEPVGDEPGEGDEEEPDGEGEESDPDESEPEQGDETEEERQAREQSERELDEAAEQLTSRAEILEEITEALDNTNYPIDLTDPEAAKIELAARLTDANFFYQIVDGTGTVEQLLDRVEQFQGAEVRSSIDQKLAEYLVKRGIIESNGEGDNGGNLDPKDEEIKRLKAELAKGRRQPNAVELRTNNQAIQLFNSAKAELKKLSDEDKLSQWQFDNVVIPALGRGVNGNKAILNRIARGNFVDVRRIYDEVRNELVGSRVRANNKKVAGRRQRDRNVPRTVAGDNRNNRAAAVTHQADLGTHEGRVAAAKRSLSGR